MMVRLGKITYVCLFLFGVKVEAYNYRNETLPPAERQLEEFQEEHPHPVGVLTTSAGVPADIRDISTINTDFTRNSYLIDSLFHFTGERVPLRVVAPIGIGAHGYFQVTHDVTQYTKADFLNKIGKKTPLFGRFSTGNTFRGGANLIREPKPFAIKMYTIEGNLDLLCESFPVYFYRDPINFPNIVHIINKNPKSNLLDYNSRWDFFTSVPETLHSALYLFSDFGLPKSYRNIDAFPIHTYPLTNKNGDVHYVKFSFRTNQGLANISSELAERINGVDQDYLFRDLYNAIARKEYPSWSLELDILKTNDVQKLDFNPFDETRLWPKGSFFTVPVGQLVLNRRVNDAFSETEQSAFNPGNLVPGINPPVTQLFRGRNFAYPDTQRHRLGRNHNNIEINRPKYAKTYRRDGLPPAVDNLIMRDAPNYYPNHFNGPVPIVDAGKLDKNIIILDKNVADLTHVSHFYNHVLPDNASRQRLADTIASQLVNTVKKIRKVAIRFMYYIDPDLAKRILKSMPKQNTIEDRVENIIEEYEEEVNLHGNKHFH